MGGSGIEVLDFDQANLIENLAGIFCFFPNQQ